MTRELRIIQVSDCHVSADPQARYRGVDPRPALESVLAAALRWRPGLLLATGDLSEDGSEASYRYLSFRLNTTGLNTADIPVLALPGNHDQPERMKTFFPAMPLDRPYVADESGWRIVLLNSALVDDPSGELGNGIFSELEAVLADDEKPVLLALHHQPVAVGSAWIDRYALSAGKRRLARLIDAHTCVRAVVWGHIHSAYRHRRNHALMLGAPSTVANSYPFEPRFSFDPSGPACRWLRLFEDGRLETGILRPGAVY